MKMVFEIVLIKYKILTIKVFLNAVAIKNRRDAVNGNMDIMLSHVKMAIGIRINEKINVVITDNLALLYFSVRYMATKKKIVKNTESVAV